MTTHTPVRHGLPPVQTAPSRMEPPAVYAGRAQHAIDQSDAAWFGQDGQAQDQALALAYLKEARIHAMLAQAAATEAAARP